MSRTDHFFGGDRTLFWETQIDSILTLKMVHFLRKGYFGKHLCVVAGHQTSTKHFWVPYGPFRRAQECVVASKKTV